MSAAERDRIRVVLNSISDPDPHTSWAAPQHLLDFWLVEHRMESERKATTRLTFATWALVATTVALVIATIALVIATATHHEETRSSAHTTPTPLVALR
jgi:hypothetical protein